MIVLPPAFLVGPWLTMGIACGQTLALHPDNPHYFAWRGRPEVLLTSAEHYGAVLNLDFDYAKYLETLRRDGCNLTRTFTGGAYLEPRGAFKIEGNTLAPAPGRFIAPWAAPTSTPLTGTAAGRDVSAAASRPADIHPIVPFRPDEAVR